MGCTVRDKHIRTNRRARSVKPEPDNQGSNGAATNGNNAVANMVMCKSIVDSGFRPLSYQMGGHDSAQNPNSATAPTAGTPNSAYDDSGWGYCTEEQLEEILLKNLDFLYSKAVRKLVELGYDEEVALKAILKNGHCYGGMDVLTNIMHNSLGYLNNGCCENSGNSEDSEPPFADLKQLEEYSLAGLVVILQQIKPHLSRGDAMWCLLMSDLHVGRASVMEIPVLPSPNGTGAASATASVSSGNVEAVVNGPVGVAPALCRFHSGWGFGNGGTSEFPVNGLFSYASEISLQKEIDCPKRFNLTPSMKSLLKRNVAFFAAGFRANARHLQSQLQTVQSSVPNGDSSSSESATATKVESVPVRQTEEPQNVKNQDVVNSVLNKFKDLNLDENSEKASLDQKDETILSLIHQIKDLERQVKERKEWAHQKAMQAARKLSHDLTELKMLKMEREETQRLKKGKQNLEDSTMKRLTEMENSLRKASGQVDRANAAVRKLETENAEIRAEMEASKLSASESVTSCLEAAKREKKYLRRLLAWEKQKAKLQEDIAADKQKISDIKQQIAEVEAAQKEAEVSHLYRLIELNMQQVAPNKTLFMI
ncbi:OLC1v1031366C1 [Oldenlandia corymbosa var. corymbosa]|uniref:OLC1v1031366C1 n=1 Tax=Oldenlandia corymbosa var. corymbosa TaxID=529605 RepID=A0AAV1CL60_OLDCO|nr:OLC1v1031366C1 [Oldenlandia corymbosa var. corymbosa]